MCVHACMCVWSVHEYLKSHCDSFVMMMKGEEGSLSSTTLADWKKEELSKIVNIVNILKE